MEKPGILQNHGESLAKFFAFDFLCRNSLKADFAGIHVIKTHQKVDYGGFSCAGGAYYRNGFARFCLNGNIFENGFFRNVSESDVINLNGTFHFLKTDSAGSVCRFRFFVNNSENSFGRGKSGLEFVKNVRKFVDGAGEFSGILNKLGDSAKGDEENRSFRNFSAEGKHIKNSAKHCNKGH